MSDTRNSDKTDKYECLACNIYNKSDPSTYSSSQDTFWEANHQCNRWDMAAETLDSQLTVKTCKPKPQRILITCSICHRKAPIEIKKSCQVKKSVAPGIVDSQSKS